MATMGRTGRIDHCGWPAEEEEEEEEEAPTKKTSSTWRRRLQGGNYWVPFFFLHGRVGSIQLVVVF